MALYICKTLISLSLNNPLRLHKSHISLLFFSSSRPCKSKHDIAVADYLIHRHHFSPEAASKASSLLTYLRNAEKSDSIVSFLKESGFSKTHLEEVIKRVPSVLSANLDHTVKPKIKVFQDLGFSPTDIAEIVSSDPWILTRSADNRLGPSILALKSVVGSNAGVSKVLKVSGWFLKHDLDKTMIPNIEFMNSCGISSSQIVKLLFNFPRFFLYKPESIKEFVKRVDEMGFDRKSKMFLHAIRVVSSMTVKNWELKLQLFRSLGFSEDDIVCVFRRVPQVFAISEKKIKEGTQLLLDTRKLGITFVVHHPELLLFSIERRVRPRLRVLEVLERKKLLLKEFSLTTICRISDQKFFDKFVLPYSSEVGELYRANEAS